MSETMKVRIVIDGLLLVVRPEHPGTRTTLRFPRLGRPPYYARKLANGGWSSSTDLDSGVSYVVAVGEPAVTNSPVNPPTAPNGGPPNWTVFAPSNLPKLFPLQGQVPMPTRGGQVVLPHGTFGASLPGYIDGNPAEFRRYGERDRWLAGVAVLEIQAVSRLIIGGDDLTPGQCGPLCDIWLRRGDLTVPKPPPTPPPFEGLDHLAIDDELPDPWRLEGLGDLHGCFDPPTAFAPHFLEATTAGFVRRGDDGPSPPKLAPLATTVFCPPPTWP